MAVLCDPCWEVYANELAMAEGATAAPSPEVGPNDTTWYEPPICPDCNMPLRRFPTNYDRWVDLGSTEVTAKAVPRRYRWRLQRTAGGTIAVRIGGIDPQPSDPVVPAHRAVCVSPDAVAEVEEERLADLAREVRTLDIEP
jgi:Family of unknown function (DUF6083)